MSYEVRKRDAPIKNPCPSKAWGNRHRWGPHASSLEHRNCVNCGALGKVDKQGVVKLVASVISTGVRLTIKTGATK